MALDRELEKMALEQPMPADIDPDPVGAMEVRKERDVYTLLSELVDGVKVASTLIELEDQVWLCKQNGCDSLEATAPLIRHFVKNLGPAGYFMYKDIRVYREGVFAESVKRDNETIEDRAFGKSKVAIASTRELKR